MARAGALSGVALFGVFVAALFVGSSTLTTADVTGEAEVRGWAQRHDALGLRLVLLEVAAFLGLVFTTD